MTSHDEPSGPISAGASICTRAAFVCDALVVARRRGLDSACTVWYRALAPGLRTLDDARELSCSSTDHPTSGSSRSPSWSPAIRAARHIGLLSGNELHTDCGYSFLEVLQAFVAGGGGGLEGFVSSLGLPVVSLP